MPKNLIQVIKYQSVFGPQYAAIYGGLICPIHRAMFEKFKTEFEIITESEAKQKYPYVFQNH